MTAREIYNCALAIMDEPPDPNYAARAVPIINTLLGELYPFGEDYDGGSRNAWEPITALDDPVDCVDKTIALSVMPYGLAAILYLDEDPVRANSWRGLYELGASEAKRQRPAEAASAADIDDMGILGNEFNHFSKW